MIKASYKKILYQNFIEKFYFMEMEEKNMEHKSYDLVIVGGGPAGLTAAIYAGRANLKVLVVEKPEIGSMLMAHKIDNYPGFADSLSGKELYSHMKFQAEKHGVKFKNATFLGVDIYSEPKVVKTDLKNYETSSVIIATGWAKNGSKKIKGEDEFLGKGVSYCATCDGAFTKNLTVALVGKGEEVAEEALFLTRYAKKVLLFVTDEKLNCSPEIHETLRENPKVEIYKEAELISIEGSDYVEKINVKIDREEKTFATDYAFLYLGTKNPTELYSEFADLDEQGYIKTTDLMHTKIPGIFAAGDVRSKHVRQITTAAADGTIAGMEAIKFFMTMKKKKEVDAAALKDIEKY